MKIWKLVAGILLIIFSVIVFFQSMLVGTANTLSSNGEVGGSAGLFVYYLYAFRGDCFNCRKK